MGDGTGRIGWIDITVDDAESLRDFCSTVVGLEPEPVDMVASASLKIRTAPPLRGTRPE